MTPPELRERCRQFAARARLLSAPLLKKRELGNGPEQLLRAAASVAANYRAACTARTRPQFIAKLCVVLEEADECVFWTDYLRDAGPIGADLDWMHEEAKALTRVFGASVRTAKLRYREAVAAAKQTEVTRPRRPPANSQ